MEEFQCHLCQSIPNNPVILQCCLKSVCRDHISDCCPYCEISLSSLDLVPNRILESLLHLDQKTCERCENKPSQLRCKQCVANLCKDCSAHLHSLGVYRRHIVTPATHSGASDSEQRCTEHKLAFTYICTDEWRPICEKCIDDHEDHAVLAFDEVLEDALNEIDSKKEKIVSQMKSLKQSSNRVKESIETVEYNANQAKKGTAQTFKSIKQVLDWKEEELITEIENLKDRKSNQLKFSEESLQKEINKLENIVQYINTAKAESATTIFTNLSYLSHIIEQALENDYSQELMVDTDFECKVVVNSVQAAIEKLSFKEETYNSIAPSPKSNVNSFTKSPKPKDITNKSSYLKRSDRSETHLVKEKSDFTFTDDKRSSTPRTQGRMSTPTHFRDQSSFQSLDENPLEKRIFIKKLQTSSAIQVSWSHPPKGSSDLIYLLEYGVGTKIQNVEQFRQVYKGPAHTCIITDLLPKTSYRFRVSPSLQSSDDKGEWSEVITITTHDTQKIDTSTCGMHASVIARGADKWIQIDRPGTVMCSNPYIFGKHVWEVKLLNNALFSNDGQSSFKIGVTQQKGKQVYGIPINYQAVKGNCKVKVVLDMEAGTLTCFSPTNPQGEVFSSLPEGALLPAFQNKPGKSSATSLKFMVNFDCRLD